MSWLELWRAHLRGETSADEIVDTAIGEHSKRVSNVLGSWLDPASPLRPTFNRMLQFHAKARDELVRLTKVGANPALLIQLANPPVTTFLAHEAEDLWASEFENIKRPDYWKEKVRRLESASSELAEFMKTKMYRAAEEGQFTKVELRLSPFARICKEVQTTKQAIDRLVQAIRGEHLDSGARKLTYNAPYVFIETDMVDLDSPAVEEREELPGHPLPYVWWQRTKRIGARGPKPDSPRREGGDGPAYALWKYLSVRTGKPRLASVAHLIMSAGWDSPVQSGVDESSVETLRKRIAKLDQDVGARLAWGDRIAKLEADLESRDHMDYGGFLTHRKRPLANERERTE